MRNRTVSQQVFQHLSLGGLALVVALAPGCILPQGESADAATASNAKSSSATSEPAASKSAPPPTPVKLTGPLLCDGASEKIQGNDTPGSWFMMMDDKSPKGKMKPESNGDFATSIVNGMIHTEGTGYTDWGGGIGFNFTDPLAPVDASAYSGISFTASGSSVMHVGLGAVATMPEFGVCQPPKCYDHYQTEITDLSSTPKTYTFKWAQLKQGHWGVPQTPLDPKTLVGLNFTAKFKAGRWDFSLKDLKFIP
jgi:hypothetical protein